MPIAAADILRQAAEINNTDPRRHGNCVRLEAGRELIVAGDIHGNRKNLAKIIRYASLHQDPRRCVVLQEVAHGPVDPATGQDRSIDLLLRAARLTAQYPQQVLFVLANHDLAQMTGREVIKDGHGVCQAFTQGVEFAFGQEGRQVLDAVGVFLKSLPLVVLCHNGVLISHSLPAPGKVNSETLSAPYRPATEADLARGGAVYEWVWGRGQNEAQVAELAGQIGVRFFVVGHRKAANGFDVFASRAVAISSADAAGCVLHFSSDEPLTAEVLAQHVKPIAALP